MKIRNGFVTNSSSSSFILSFVDEEEYDDFRMYCEENEYPEIYKMIQRFRKANRKVEKTELKKAAIANLKQWMLRDWKHDYIEQFLTDDMSFAQRRDREKEVLNSEEYKKSEAEYLKQTNYEACKQKIEQGDIVICETIWESCGGILEYAIRHGILYKLRPWFIYQIDIG